MTSYSNPIAESMIKHHKKYRPDIDGLRAVAVLCVVIFHGFPYFLPGGFVGVDIFFVMSGFLISTILFESLIDKKFSFFDFYLRRAKRIFPSLIFVLVFCYFIGWNFLFPNEFKGLSKHIFGGAIFLSNFVSFLENGYFDVSADFKPLLHLWSLGIEEQFYIIWPLVLWFSWKKNISLKLIVLFAIAISFLFNIWNVETNSNAAFYLPHMRFWELLIGAFLAYLTIFEKDKTSQFTKRYADQLSLLGTLTLLIALICITKEAAFPGWWALLPTFSTACLIMAGPNAWINRKILSMRIMIWFGLISFPLYLWHWPLLSFARILWHDHVSTQLICCLILLSIIMAWLTYKFIETPIRFGKSSNRSYYSLTALLMTIGAIGIYSFDQEGKGGLPRSFLADNAVSISGYDGGYQGQTIAGCGKNRIDLDVNFSICTSDRRDKPRYALIGDSKALALYPGLIRTSNENGRWALIGGNGRSGPVAPILSDEKIYEDYQKNAIAAVEKIAANPEFETIVIVAATRGIFSLNNIYSIDDLEENKNFDIALAGVQNFTRKVLLTGKMIVFVIDNPTFKDPKDCLPRRLHPDFVDKFINGNGNVECKVKISDQIKAAKKYRQLLLKVKDLNPEKIRIFDTTDILCDTVSASCSMTKNGRLLYGYSDHISDYAAGLIGRKLNRYLNAP